MQRALQRQSQGLCRPQVRHHRLYLGNDLRGDVVDNRDATHRIAQFLGELVDAIERVVERSKRPAYWDVEAVRLPIEVVPDGPEEVVIVGQMIAGFLGESL